MTIINGIGSGHIYDPARFRGSSVLFDRTKVSMTGSLVRKIGPVVLSVGCLDIYGDFWKTRIGPEFNFPRVDMPEIRQVIFNSSDKMPNLHILLSDLSYLDKSDFLGLDEKLKAKGNNTVLALDVESLYHALNQNEYFKCGDLERIDNLRIALLNNEERFFLSFNVEFIPKIMEPLNQYAVVLDALTYVYPDVLLKPKKESAGAALDELRRQFDGLYDTYEQTGIGKNFEPILGVATRLAHEYLEAGAHDDALEVWEVVKSLGLSHRDIRRYLGYLKKKVEQLTPEERARFELAGDVLFRIAGQCLEKKDFALAKEFFLSASIVSDRPVEIAKLYSASSAVVQDLELLKTIAANARAVVLPIIKRNLRTANADTLSLYLDAMTLLDFKGGGKPVYQLYVDIAAGLMKYCDPELVMADVRRADKLGRSDVIKLEKVMENLKPTPANPIDEPVESVQRTQILPAARAPIKHLSSKQKYELDLFICRGINYKNEDRNQLAVAEFKKALRLDPNNFPAHFNLADLYRTGRKLTPAKEHYLKALGLECSDLDRALVYCGFAICLRLSGDIKQSIENAKQAVDIASNAVNLKELAHGYFILGDYETAKTFIAQSLSFSPDDEVSLNLQAKIRFRQAEELWEDGHYDDAIKYADGFEETDPVAFWKIEALGYLGLGNVEQAINKLELLLKRAPDDIAAKVKMASALYILRQKSLDCGNELLAADCHKKSLELLPENEFLVAQPDVSVVLAHNVEWYYMMSYFCLLTANIDAGLRYSFESMEKHPGLALPYQTAAYLYFAQKDFDNAVLWYKKGIEISTREGADADIEYFIFQLKKISRKIKAATPLTGDAVS